MRIAAFLVTIAFAASANAAVIVSNLSEPTTGVSNLTTPPGVGIVAGGFTTGNNIYVLQAATMSLSGFNSPVTFEGRLYSDAGGAPGVLLETFTNNPSTSSSVFTDLTFNSSGTILQPNTDYWFSVHNIAGLGRAALTTTNNETSSDGWLINDLHVFSFDGGATWPVFPQEPQFSIDAVAQQVPEPGTMAIWGVMGCLGLAARRRRKQ